MPIVAKESSRNRDFIPAPAGAHAAVCCDIVDLGTLEVTYGGKTKKQHKVRVVWQIAEVMADNKPYIVQKRYTLSLHEKAGLRKDLESWRGRAFTQEELQGFDLEKLLSVPCFLNVLQVVKEGETWSNVASIMRLPKGMEPLKVRDYVRVCDRKPDDEAGEQQGPPEHNFGGIDDSDIPF